MNHYKALGHQMSRYRHAEYWESQVIRYTPNDGLLMILVQAWARS